MFPTLDLMSTSCGAAAKPMSTFPSFDVARTIGERVAEAVMSPSRVLILREPDMLLTLTCPLPPSMTTEPESPDTVSLPSPECTTTDTSGGTATWNLRPHLKTSPEQSTRSVSVSPLSVHDEWPGLAAVPLSHRWTWMPEPLPGTTRRSDEGASMTRRFPLRLKDFWPETWSDLPQALKVSNVAATATAEAGVRRSFTFIILPASATSVSGSSRPESAPRRTLIRMVRLRYQVTLRPEECHYAQAPEFGWGLVARMRISEDLPAPLGPSRPSTPGPMRMLTSATACFPPRELLVRLRMSNCMSPPVPVFHGLGLAGVAGCRELPGEEDPGADGGERDQFQQRDG